MKPGITCRNEYTIRKVDASGAETVEARFHNVPLKAFYNAVIGRSPGFSNTSTVHSCRFGTGSREPSASDTDLESPLWTYGGNSSNLISWEKYLNGDGHICHRYTFKVAADADHVGTVSEVGVAFLLNRNLWMALATRALILDAEGNPITITKTDTEVLYVDVVFEFTLRDTAHFRWLPGNYIGYGDASGTGWGPIFTLGLYNRIYFFARLGEDGFRDQLAYVNISKSYTDDSRELDTSGGRLAQDAVPDQRYIRAIAVGCSDGDVLLGYWTLPDGEVIPPKTLTGMDVGTGDGATAGFGAPLAEWVEGSEEVYVDGVPQVRDADYTCVHDANTPGLAECSVFRDMVYTGEYTTAPQNVITPILGRGPREGGGYRTALWNAENPTLTYAFPEGEVRPVRRIVLKDFVTYYSIAGASATLSRDWSGAVWTVGCSDDGEEWRTAGEAEMDTSNVAEVVLDSPVTARHWRFTVSSGVRGMLFAAWGTDSLVAYGDGPAITFRTPPPAGAVITMDATVDRPMKNRNFVLDVNPVFEI